MDDLFSVNKATHGGKDDTDGAGVNDKKKKESSEVMFIYRTACTWFLMFNLLLVVII